MSHKKMWHISSLAAALIAAGFALPASAATQDRSGKEVVDAVCSGCHATGKDGAPQIGDMAAWSKRASNGLDKLAENAITGVRKMPAHGGQASLTDLEITRAISYMVSGGHTVDPKKPYASPQHMTGKELVESRCQTCHGPGKDGAPKIGDMEAWKPRVAKGMDVLLRSALNGHNAMPARAGMANLSDSEMKSALIYMVNTSAAAAQHK